MRKSPQNFYQYNRGGGGQQSPILRQHSLWTAPKVSRKFEFLHVFGAAEKIQAKVSRNVLFCQENKNSNVDNFLPEFDKNPPMFS